MRSLVQQHIDATQIQLGGPGIICDIDESLMTHKTKYRRGRRPPQLWCFGIVDTSFSPAKGYIQLVPNRNRDTLFAIISRVVRPGTIIRSDQWRAYNTIESNLGLAHETVNHSRHFVDPGTLVHTQHVESYWNRVKTPLKTMKGIGRRGLVLYLAEFMWKDIYRERTLLALIGLLQALE